MGCGDDLFDPFGILEGEEHEAEVINFYGPVKKFKTESGVKVGGLRAIYDRAKKASDLQFLQASGILEDVGGLIDKGYGDARTRVDEIRRGREADILEREADLSAELQQSFIDRGLPGSTSEFAARRGLSSATTRQLAGLDASLSELLIGLDERETQSRMGLAGQRADLALGKAGQEFQFASARASGILGQPVIAPYTEPSIAEKIGPIVGAAIAACWPARAAFGDDDPRWVLFYLWKERHAPRWFRFLYNRLGRFAAKFIRGPVRPIVRWGMEACLGI